MNCKALLWKAEEVSFVQDFSGPWLCSRGYEPPVRGYSCSICQTCFMDGRVKKKVCRRSKGSDVLSSSCGNTTSKSRLLRYTIEKIRRVERLVQKTSCSSWLSSCFFALSPPLLIPTGNGFTAIVGVCLRETLQPLSF